MWPSKLISPRLFVNGEWRDNLTEELLSLPQEADGIVVSEYKPDPSESRLSFDRLSASTASMLIGERTGTQKVRVTPYLFTKWARFLFEDKPGFGRP